MTTIILDKSKYTEECSFTLETYESLAKREKLVSANCGHMFSKEDLMSWTSKQQNELKQNPTCPICLKEIGTAFTTVMIATDTVAKNALQKTCQPNQSKNRDLSIEDFSRQENYDEILKRVLEQSKADLHYDKYEEDLTEATELSLKSESFSNDDYEANIRAAIDASLSESSRSSSSSSSSPSSSSSSNLASPSSSSSSQSANAGDMLSQYTATYLQNRIEELENRGRELDRLADIATSLSGRSSSSPTSSSSSSGSLQDTENRIFQLIRNNCEELTNLARVDSRVDLVTATSSSSNSLSSLSDSSSQTSSANSSLPSDPVSSSSSSSDQSSANFPFDAIFNFFNW